jgi:hypothetical protein
VSAPPERWLRIIKEVESSLSQITDSRVYNTFEEHVAVLLSLRRCEQAEKGPVQGSNRSLAIAIIIRS